MRCNCGVDPRYLADQHLIVEARELGMVAGSLKANGFRIVGNVPMKFKLGTGHINFFKDKLQYLHERWLEVVEENKQRGFNIQKPFYDLKTFPAEYVNSWKPDLDASRIIRGRIIEKLNYRIGWYRFHGEYITESMHKDFCNRLANSPLYCV